MVARPVTPGKARATWKLASPHDVLTQGLVVSGFGSLPTGRALFLEFGWPMDGRPTGAWLETLARVAPVTDADGRDPRAAALSFTFTGLAKMRLPSVALDSFSRPFREGMMQVDRLRRLGDRRGGEWLRPVLPGGPKWSGNAPLPPASSGDEHTATPVTVHALLLLYAADEAEADAWASEVEQALQAHDVRVVRRLGLLLDPDPVQARISREHFGFADGLSQPEPYDDLHDAVTVGGRPASGGGTNSVPLGEFLIGHVNGHNETAPGPITPAGSGAAATVLPPHPLAEGFRDLGLDGSYMVVRELKQDVAAFWRSMEASAAEIRAADPGARHVTAEWLAERVVGRDRDGHLLCPAAHDPSGRLPAVEGMPDSSFLFFDRDRHGTGCPAGSHVRRANPRDGLAPKASMKQTLLDAANNHRILRRGRKFGRKMEDPAQDDGADRGLLFVCLNTDIARQFEFVQQTWLMNDNFDTLFGEKDPLVGPVGPMTIPEDPLRRIVEVETYVQMAGGDYFFLPSLPALRYLSSL